MQIVTLSLAVPLGLLAIICGVILLLVNRGKRKRTAVAIIAACMIVLGVLAMVTGAFPIKL